MTASSVKRYHTFPIIGEQTVGHHSHRVAMLLTYLTNDCVTANMLKAALFHDLAEVDTGDVPATTKWANPAIAQALTAAEDSFDSEHETRIDLSDEERVLLKVADMLELMIFATEQRRLGSLEAKRLYQRGLIHLRGLAIPANIKERVDLLIYHLNMGQML